MAAPKRKPETLADKIARRDGLNCFLCGRQHVRASAMSVGYIHKDNTTLDAAFLACGSCIRRRDTKSLGAYFRERIISAGAELSYLKTMFDRDNPASARNYEVMRILQNIDELPEMEVTIEPERHIRNVPKPELAMMTWDEMKTLDRKMERDERDDGNYLDFELSAKARQGIEHPRHLLHVDEHNRVYVINMDGIPVFI
jgi:hypothetical protein